jgi:hypothetical protein
MALQADELYLRAVQHPRIYRSVRLVTGAAAFQPHWGVFENKGASKVAMAFHAARFIGIHETHVAREVATVRVVAIHARHGAFRQAVPVRPLEAGPDIRVALRAELIHSDYFLCYQPIWTILMDRVAGRTTHLVFGMTAINASYICRLVQMTGKADAIGFGWLQFGRLFDIRGGRRVSVLAARPVATLAGFGCPAPFLIRFHHFVRVFLECVEDVLVTHLAGRGANVCRRFVIRRRRSGSARFILSAPQGS